MGIGHEEERDGNTGARALHTDTHANIKAHALKANIKQFGLRKLPTSKQGVTKNESNSKHIASALNAQQRRQPEIQVIVST
jgi:hypothetical protein